ncbi:MAG: hypothetical protein K2P51_05330 [Rhabdochlamydiaceae bacterium]|nr:hypothetical protein [Rhabdochlamydiaceae bacterium]
MNKKKLIGTIVFILGVCLIGISMYITSEVNQGKIKINRAQEQVDQGGSLFSMNPVAKEIGKGITGSAQRKIDEGKSQVVEYEAIARMAQISGIILIVLGLGLVFLGKPSKR